MNEERATVAATQGQAFAHNGRRHIKLFGPRSICEGMNHIFAFGATVSACCCLIDWV